MAEQVSAAVVKPKSTNKGCGVDSADGKIILSRFTLAHGHCQTRSCPQD